jgi:hypothetical protein
MQDASYTPFVLSVVDGDTVARAPEPYKIVINVLPSMRELSYRAML